MSFKNVLFSALSFLALGAGSSFAQCGTWTTSTIQNCDGMDYELWNQNNTGTASMTITGGESNPNGGTFEATWDKTINILARAGKKWGSSSTTTARSIGNISLEFEATWNSTDNVKMLGIYGWAYYPSGSEPTQTESGQSENFSNQIEYYIIQDRGSYNPASGGTNAKKYGEGTIDGIDYDFWMADRIGQPMLTGNGNFKQYFSVPKNTSAHRQSGVVSISKHFEAWENAGMKILDCPLYEVAMKVESYTGSPNGNGSASVTKNLLTLGATGNQYSLSANASPSAGGSVIKNPDQTYFDPNASVELTAVPKEGWTFVGWSGALSGTTNPATLTMTDDQSVTAEFQLIGGEDTTNLIKEGEFSAAGVISTGDGAAWKLGQGQYWGDSEASSSVNSGAATIQVATIGTQSYQPQLVQYGLPLESGMMYKLSFKASADVARKIEASFQQASDPWAGYASKEFDIGTTEAEYEFVFTMNSASDEAAQFAFNLGQATGSVTLSDVRLVFTTDSVTSAFHQVETQLEKGAFSTQGKTLHFALPEKANVQVLDLTGKVRAQFLIASESTHSLNNLPAGAYIVDIQGETQSFSKGIVLK